MVCSVAGITSDANVLTNELRVIAQRFQLNYGEPMPCEQLVSYLCDIKQAYTQYGGKRPFGVSILYMGWDKHYGYQLYQSDPSGNYGGWKATCIGNNSSVSKKKKRFFFSQNRKDSEQFIKMFFFKAAVSILKQELTEDKISLANAQDLVVKVLSKTLDMTKLTSEKGEFKQIFIPYILLKLLCSSVEMATLTRENNKTVIKILSNAEVDVLIAKYEKSEAELEAAKKEKLSQKS